MVGLIISTALVILGAYSTLFWAVGKGMIGYKEASILVIVSLVSYLLFPSLAQSWGIQQAVICLVVFILCGISVVLGMGQDIKRQRKISFSFNINSFKQRFADLNLLQTFKPFVSKVKESVSCIKKQSDKFHNTTPNQAYEEGVGQNIPTKVFLETESFAGDENLSYVDFEGKSSRYEDVFSKYIRGEIALGDVSKRIKERLDKKNMVSENQETNRRNQERRELPLLINRKSDYTYKEEACTVDEHGGIDSTIDNDRIKSNEEMANDNTELTIEQCIERAFELKSDGQLLEAVDYYIQALDKKPDDQLIMWIVVDICSLYKQLGQNNLAKEMMESYIETFGDNISPQLKEEIMRNL